MKAMLTALAATALFATQAQAMEASDLVKDPDVFVGIGFGNFTGDLGSLTNSGITWDGRIGVNPSPFWGAELNYQGLHSSVGTVITQGGNLVGGQSIVQQEISVDAKAGIPFLVADHQLKPYALVGVGYAHVGANNVLHSVGIESSDAFAMPFGAGVSYALNDTFNVDGRFTYNLMTGSRGTLTPSGDAWNAGINVGAHFGGATK